MKPTVVLTWAISNIASTMLAGASCYMAINGIEGWGWFMFACVITARSLEVMPDKKEEEKR